MGGCVTRETGLEFEEEKFNRDFEKIKENIVRSL